jgi:restriction system protein
VAEDSLIEKMLRSFLDMSLALWPLWLLLGLILLVRLIFEVYRLRRLSKSGIAEVDRMDGRTFEQFLGTVFRRLGYKVELTRYRGDYGADLVVVNDRTRMAVQAKRWTKTVGVKAVQEAVAAKGFYKGTHALVVANQRFTEQARRLARANAVELWDRDVLASKLLEVSGVAATVEASTAPPLPVGQVAGAAVEDTCCASCGVVVSARVRDYCQTHADRFGGRVYCFKHQRKQHAS